MNFAHKTRYSIKKQMNVINVLHLHTLLMLTFVISAIHAQRMIIRSAIHNAKMANDRQLLLWLSLLFAILIILILWDCPKKKKSTVKLVAGVLCQMSTVNVISVKMDFTKTLTSITCMMGNSKFVKNVKRDHILWKF